MKPFLPALLVVTRTLSRFTLLLTLGGLVGVGARYGALGWMWRNQVIYRAPVRQRAIALTFDDGPHPVYTPEILQILRDHHAVATFFVTGRHAQQYPGLIRSIVAEGSALGNHTYTHPHDYLADSPAAMLREMDACEAVLRRLTGKPSHLFRPPLGRVDREVLETTRLRGYEVVLWTVCGDHHDAPTPELMAQRLIAHAVPGAILLLHDGTYASRWKDVEATRLALPALARRGYRFVTVPQLLRMSQASAPPSA